MCITIDAPFQIFQYPVHSATPITPQLGAVRGPYRATHGSRDAGLKAKCQKGGALRHGGLYFMCTVPADGRSDSERRFTLDPDLCARVDRPRTLISHSSTPICARASALDLWTALFQTPPHHRSSFRQQNHKYSDPRLQRAAAPPPTPLTSNNSRPL